MILHSKNTSVICPKNDAESFTIAAIAESKGFDLRISTQNTWFSPLDKESKEIFFGLKENVIIVEMPSLDKEKELISCGHKLYIVDHHNYPTLNINREKDLSSLEQFCLLIDHTMDRKEWGIAINDQLYIYGLFEKNYTLDEINEIRMFDLQCQGYTKDQLNQSIQDLNTKEMLSMNTYHYTSSIPKFTYLCDLHIMRNRGEFSNILISGLTNDERGKYLFFSGEMCLIEKLRELGGYSRKSDNNYGLWGGYEFGKEKVSIVDAFSILKGGDS